MARKNRHDEHTNHEAWAIPYGDLVTLMFALFVVMYAVSSINEGKFRVLSESLSEAFGGPPKSISPIQIGEKISHGADHSQKMSVLPTPVVPQSIGALVHRPEMSAGINRVMTHGARADDAGRLSGGQANLTKMSEEVQRSMADLIHKGLIVVRRGKNWLEVEIKADILFPSGVATISSTAVPVLQQLAGIIKPFPNSLRIEGHTDNQPISTVAFPSNWELSAARAASVVYLFVQSGVAPQRMSVEGFGEYRPVDSNDTAEGRNRNRRVVLVVLALPEDPHLRQLQAQTDDPDPAAVAAP
ncbi:MAG: flagellar motor protein MotD [Stenotrophobium sp.]